MRCTEVHENLELLVLGSLPGEAGAAVRAHLDACPECRDAAEDCRELLRQIREASDRVSPSPAFERAVRSAVAGEIRGQRRRHRLQRAVAVAGSAAALLLVGLGIWSARNGGTRGLPGLQEAWQYASAQTAPASIADGVVVRGGSVFVLCSDAAGPHVVCIDAATGAPRWRSARRSAGYLAADDRRVYCLSSDRPRRAEMVALDAATGRELWRYAPGDSDPVRAPCRPVPLDGGRVCWTLGRAVHLLDGATGRLAWRRAIEGEGPLSRPVAHAGRLIVATGHALHCLATDSGEDTWAKRLESAPKGQDRPQLAVADDRIYLVQTAIGRTSRLSCMDAETHGVLWTRAVPRTRWLLAAGEDIYLRGEQILALDGSSGKPLWERSATGCGPLTHMDGLICFVDVAQNGSLVVLNRRTGATTWEVPGIRSCDAFNSVGSTGLIKTGDGTVRAFTLNGLNRS